MDRPRDILSNRNPRIEAFYWLFALAFLVLICALAYRQIFMYDEYVAMGERQSMRRVIEPGVRGDIFDRSGKLLVTNRPRFSAVVYFNEIRLQFREEYFKLKKSKIAAGEKVSYSELTREARERVLNGYVEEINRVLGTDYKLPDADFNKHFSQRVLLPFPLVKNLTPKEHAILAEKIPVDSPIQIYTDSVRYYPYGDCASHVLGYVRGNFDDVETVGMPGENLRTYTFAGKMGCTGIEKAFDEHLTGGSGAKIWVVDLDGFQYDVVADVPPTKGNSVISSLDIDIQQEMEERFGDRKGAAIAMDVRTGEVLAMVSKPAYDPNMLSPYISSKVYAEITERDAWLNRATQGLYPPGSTFKIVTACAGLMTGVIEPDSVKECLGGLKVGSRIFPCNSRYGHGNLSLSSAIAHSCNVYFYETALDCDVAAIVETAKDFGLNSWTGIELKEDAWRLSIIANPQYKRRRGDGPWLGGDTANMSIGQGYMRQTPLQMVCMTASFASKRTRTKASILRDSSHKNTLEYHGAEKLDLSESQYAAILEGMKQAVRSGTCRSAAVDGVEVAAKSGTAQVMSEGKKLALAWMISFAPADNPEIATVVIVEGEEPGDVAGGRTAGPITGAALKKYFRTRAGGINIE